MSELLCFQEFGIRKSTQHVIDPSVMIEIQEAIIRNPSTTQVTGALFGKQHATNLVISSVLVIPIGESLENGGFKENSNLEYLLEYHERVYSVNFVGLFARKSNLDREGYFQLSGVFPFKKTTDFIFLTVDFDLETTNFVFKAYSNLRNKYFKDLFAAFQQVPVKIGFVEENYLKGEFRSGSGYLFGGGNHP